MGCKSSKDQHQHTLSGFQPIPDRFTSIAQVQAAVREAGLESSNLILGVDFTKSNTWTGLESFEGRCLHDTTGPTNPYQKVIDIIGRTLEKFDDDRLIPAFGFGDVTTGNKKCFPFNANNAPSLGVEGVINRYNEIAQTVQLAGPTCFAPVIREAIKIVREEQSYHILVIIADGQVTDQSATGETAKAIIEASQYPISIVVVGVGDGPWDAMRHYDDELPERKFDNFQFVEWNAIQHSRRSGNSLAAIEAQFALAALMEVPEQYAFIKQAGLLNPSSFPQRMSRDSVLAPAQQALLALPAPNSAPPAVAVQVKPGKEHWMAPPPSYEPPANASFGHSAPAAI